MENLDKMVDKLIAKIQNVNEHKVELNKNKSAQVFQKQQLYTSVKSIKSDTVQNAQIQYDDFVSVINVIPEYDDKAISDEEKCDKIIIDGLTESKEIKELKQCNKMHNILKKDIKEDKPTIIKNINDNERCVYTIY